MFGRLRHEIIGKSVLELNILAPYQITKAARNLAPNIFGKSTEPEEYIVLTSVFYPLSSVSYLRSP